MKPNNQSEQIRLISESSLVDLQPEIGEILVEDLHHQLRVDVVDVQGYKQRETCFMNLVEVVEWLVDLEGVLMQVEDEELLSLYSFWRKEIEIWAPGVPLRRIPVFQIDELVPLWLPMTVRRCFDLWKLSQELYSKFGTYNVEILECILKGQYLQLKNMEELAEIVSDLDIHFSEECVMWGMGDQDMLWWGSWWGVCSGHHERAEEIVDWICSSNIVYVVMGNIKYCLRKEDGFYTEMLSLFRWNDERNMEDMEVFEDQLARWWPGSMEDLDRGEPRWDEGPAWAWLG